MVEELKIPGLNSFVKQEIILGIIPYFALIFLIFQNQYVSISLNSLGFILLVALQLVIGGLVDLEILSINENFKKYF